MQLISTPYFLKKAAKVYSNELELFSVMDEIADNPLKGDLIPSGKGLHKIRTKLVNKGKRGGARVIYYYIVEPTGIIFLDCYAKSEKENLSAVELKNLTKEIE